ncbi:class I SAM-dependent methyltransferase [Variovorax sp. RB3P1]|uniref:class I SAM-dependent methyltransferase n=1 Tax=Variovorax sp. RB3P1 TaxID=3443732 RepID=UPI003F484CB6
MTDFYDELAPLYHLIYPDWSESIRVQGQKLARLIDTEWPAHVANTAPRKVLDVSCGIGTQALGLAALGHAVTASDLSANEIARARREAGVRGLGIRFSVCDMREAHTHHGGGFDLVMSCDNSVPHLQTDEDLLVAFRQMAACLRPGGGCVVSVRDYANEPRGTNLVKHYGARVEDGRRHVLFQVWDFDDEGRGAHYDLGLFFVTEDLATQAVSTRVMRSRYYAVSTVRLCELMRNAGLENVRRIDDAFFQPVLVGTRPAR